MVSMQQWQALVVLEQAVPALSSVGNSLHAELPAWEKWIAATESQASAQGLWQARHCSPPRYRNLVSVVRIVLDFNAMCHMLAQCNIYAGDE
jgi:hypothetical protein